jgi:hypothetical protein
MRTIPGEATEIRYRRTGPLAGRYYHRFRPGVRMRANRDGSVTLRGRNKIHAVESEPGFWDKYGGRANPPDPQCKRCGGPTIYKSGICRYCQTAEEKSSKASERGNPRRPAPRTVHFGSGGRRRRRARAWGNGAPFNWTPVWVLGLVWLWQSSRGATAGETIIDSTSGAGAAVSLSDQLRSLLGGDLTPSPYVSSTDIVRTMQAEAEAQAAAAEAGASYTGLSDVLRSGFSA